MQCNRRAAKIVLVWFVKEAIMATRYAGKYRRSAYSQATRIPVKNILLLSFCNAYHWRGRFGIPLRTNFFFAGDDDNFYWEGHVPLPLFRTLTTTILITWLHFSMLSFIKRINT